MEKLAEKNRFSWIYDGDRAVDRPAWDTVVLENKKFVVLPSLGSLVPGWLLVVPKRPVANLASLTSEERLELVSLVASAKRRLSAFPGDVFVFEHGGVQGSPLSCGVDQAHLHIVPLTFDLIEASLQTSDVRWIKSTHTQDPWSDPSISSEYLVLSNLADTYVGHSKKPTSQWFRKLIANRIGRSDSWNYREFPNLDIVDKTLAVMAS
tara:strand:+ start:445 stop:1068 length:624 start_codon:yes stop_codon:yes gene_type:complete